MKIMRIISGSMILFSVLIGGFVGYDGSGTYELDVPSCASDEIQQLGNDSVNFCDKSMMMEESIDIPSALNLFIDIEVGAEWDEPGMDWYCDRRSSRKMHRNRGLSTV